MKSLLLPMARGGDGRPLLQAAILLGVSFLIAGSGVHLRANREEGIRGFAEQFRIWRLPALRATFGGESGPRRSSA
jgi:hypothetical protein